jgi:hypothetical protein
MKEQEIKQVLNTEVKTEGNAPVASSANPTDARSFDRRSRGPKRDGSRPPREQK